MFANCPKFEFFPFNSFRRIKNDCNVDPTALESHAAEGTVN